MKENTRQKVVICIRTRRKVLVQFKLIICHILRLISAVILKTVPTRPKVRRLILTCVSGAFINTLYYYLCPRW